MVGYPSFLEVQYFCKWFIMCLTVCFTGRDKSGSSPSEMYVTNGMTPPDKAHHGKLRAATEPLGAYSLVGQVPEGKVDPVTSSSSLSSSVITTSPSGGHLPFTSPYYRAPSPQPTWQTSPISDTVPQSSVLQPLVSHQYDRLPPPQVAWQVPPSTDFDTVDHPSDVQQISSTPSSAQLSWSPSTLAPTNRRNPYDVVPPPRPAPLWNSGTSTLPALRTEGLLNDRSRPHKRYDHPPGSSATSEYAVPPFSKEELYMVPRRSPGVTYTDPPPPVIDRSSKPGEGPTIDRSVKPGSQSDSPMPDQAGWRETNIHSADKQGTNRKIHYSEIILPETPTSPIGPSQPRTHYSEIDIAATMKRRESSDNGQGSSYQDDPRHVGGVKQTTGTPYINMQDMAVPLNKGGAEYYIAMQNGVFGEYYTYMRDQAMESDDIYSAASRDGRPFPNQEDPYGVMFPPGSNGMPPSSTMVR